MGIFSRIRRKNNETPELPGGMLNNDNSEQFRANGTKGLDAIYAFLQFDYESRGYNDALTNPDESYRNDNIMLIKHDLMILIDRTMTYYETLLKETDFHISSRSRAGLVDLVEELKIKKELTNDHLDKVRKLKEEAAGDEGPSRRIVLSYQRGFMRGLYAISQSKLFNGNL